MWDRDSHRPTGSDPFRGMRGPVFHVILSGTIILLWAIIAMFGQWLAR